MRRQLAAFSAPALISALSVVADSAGAKCDLLSSAGTRMIGAFGFVSGTVAPSYGGGGAGGWGKTFLIALIVVSSVYLVGGAVSAHTAPPLRAGPC